MATVFLPLRKEKVSIGKELIQDTGDAVQLGYCLSRPRLCKLGSTAFDIVELAKTGQTGD